MDLFIGVLAARANNEFEPTTPIGRSTADITLIAAGLHGSATMTDLPIADLRPLTDPQPERKAALAIARRDHPPPDVGR